MHLPVDANSFSIDGPFIATRTWKDMNYAFSQDAFDLLIASQVQWQRQVKDESSKLKRTDLFMNL